MSENAKNWTPNQERLIEWLSIPKELREPHTQREFAESIGINEATISRWKKLPGLTDEATVETLGRPGAYVTRQLVMRRAAMADLGIFLRVAEYLEGQGWIAEADADYGVFVLTPAGIDEAMR